MRTVLREELPNRRFAAGIPFEHIGIEYMAHVGRFADGRVAEIFISCLKSGSQLDTSIREASTILSIALQFGADFEKIRKAIPRDSLDAALTPLGQLMDILAAEPPAEEAASA